MSNDNTKTGFVFKDQDEVFLGIFENGGVTDFNPISDFDGIYENLLPTNVMVVEIEFDTNDRIMINDLCSIQVGLDDDDGFTPVEFTELLNDLEFPSDDMNDMFIGFAKEAGSKTNVN